MRKLILRKIFRILPAGLQKFITDLRIQKLTFSALAKDYGQFNSIRKASCLDRKGKPLPWYTYPAIEYLSHINFSTLRVFEFGSGNSSLWWAKRCRSLTSIESDQQWFGKVSQEQDTSPNFDYRLEKTEAAYTLSPGLKDADIVIIDGKYRSKCADAFIEACNENEKAALMLLFDNADWYPNTIKKIQQSLGWVQVDFHGFGPINYYTWTTSIFINPKRIPELQYVRPLMSIAGIDNAVGNVDDAR